jgi:hypothetical protein
VSAAAFRLDRFAAVEAGGTFVASYLRGSAATL